MIIQIERSAIDSAAWTGRPTQPLRYTYEIIMDVRIWLNPLWFWEY
jgi:hypothetical protein